MACVLLLIVEEGKKVWRIKSRGHQTFVLRGSVGDDLHVEGNWSANECVRTGTWYRKHDDGDQSKQQLIYTCKKNQPLRVSLVIIVSHSGLQWNLKVRQDDIRFLKVYIKLEETFDYYCTATTALKVFDKLNMWFLKSPKDQLFNSVIQHSTL